MSLSLCPRSQLSRERALAFESTLKEYYSNPPASYYLIVDQGAGPYTQARLPFHWDLVNRIETGMTVLELGCGSAHLCPQVEERGGRYLGMDHSADLLEDNRRRFPCATFLPIASEPLTQFDLVASLYTIEHVVDPVAYLERAWGLCKPGGMVAIICPDFIDGEGFSPSIFYGKTPRRLREKLRGLDLSDALLHILDLKWKAPRWKAKARSTPVGAFWINTKPSELFGARHNIDTDAVHLPRLTDLIWWFENKEATILTTSRSIPNIPPQVSAFNCYLVAQKPIDRLG
jgi:SAM-dependent methyltransferase